MKMDFRSLLEDMNRRDALCRAAPHCQKCLDEQVQLVSSAETPAKWKCRICKHRFEYEPGGNDP